MELATTPGQIVILNGAPRSGKSSIATFIQDTFEGVWMNLGVDTFVRDVTPTKYRPGIGLRPGEDGHPLHALIPFLYAAMYDSIAAHSRLGLNVVVDVGHHNGTSPNVLTDCARRLEGLPVLFVGVRCPIDVIMERRSIGQRGREDQYVVGTADEPVPAPVALWQTDVHIPGVYDLDVDTAVLGPDECAAAIHRRLADGPPGSAFRTLAARSA